MSEESNKETVVPKKNKYIEKLRDPIWQFFSVVAAFVLFALPLTFSYFFSSNEPVPFVQKESLQIGTYIATGASVPNSISSRTKIVIDGKEARDTQLSIYYFKNSGTKPITKESIVMPITGTIPSDRKILSIGVLTAGSPTVVVQSQVNSQKGEALNKINLVDLYPDTEIPKPIKVEIKIINENSFEIIPTLINPSEWFGIETLTALKEMPSLSNSSSAKNSKISPQPSPTFSFNDVENRIRPKNLEKGEIEFSCRIINVECPDKFVYDGKISVKYKFQIQHYDKAIYFIVIFNSFSLIFFLILINQTENWKSQTNKGLLLYIFLTLLSLANAEILADYFFNDNDLSTQPRISTVGLIMYGLIVILILLPLIKKCFQSNKTK